MGNIEEDMRSLAISKIKLSIFDMLTVEEQEIHVQSIIKKISEEWKYAALKEVYMSKYKQHYNNLIDSGDADKIEPIFKELREKNEEKFKSNLYFITINPYPKKHLSLEQFKKLLERVMKKTWIKRYCLVIEQRGENEDELGKGVHTHMLIDKGDFRHSHLLRDFKTIFENVTDTSNPCCYNIKPCKEEDICKRQKYMLGRKASPDKWIKQEMDKVFREKYNIPAYYGEMFIDTNYNELETGVIMKR